MQAGARAPHSTSDHLGSTTLVTCYRRPAAEGCPDGAVARYFRYDAYGMTRAFDAAGSAVSDGDQLLVDRLYTGQRWEWRLGVYDYEARFYEPRVARFLAHDPAREYMNPYAYVGWRPTVLIDPTGMQPLAPNIGSPGCGTCDYGPWMEGRSPTLFPSQEPAPTVGEVSGEGAPTGSTQDAPGGDSATPLPGQLADTADEGLTSQGVVEPSALDPAELVISIILLGGVGAPAKEVGKGAARGLLGRLAAMLGRGSAARGATAAARQLGRAGEAAVRAAHDIGPSQAIKIGGRTRFPDGLTSTTLSEVKNVQSLSYTSQLRDYAAFARQEGLTFNLYVRPGAQLSQPLLDARAGRVNILEIPFR
jgi:RHS repeat-associated protein